MIRLSESFERVFRDDIRSILLERGYVVAQGHARLRLLLGELS